MIRFMMAVVLLAAVLAAQTLNWNGYGDTSQVHLFRSDSLRYSKVFPLSMYENMAVVTKFDDTASAGFASDSCVFTYGYQVGYPVYNSSGTYDTAWYSKIRLESITSANIGKVNDGTTDSLGQIALSPGSIDTSSVSGYAISIAQYAPPWGVFLRYYAQGAAGNSKGTYVKLIFDHKRRLYYNVSKGN
jgi:hypothetical protein